MNVSPPDRPVSHPLSALLELDIVPTAAGRRALRRRGATGADEHRERAPSTPNRPPSVTWPLAQVARISPPRARPKVSKQ